MGTRPILQVLKIFLVFLLKPYNIFFPVLVSVLVPVPETASVNFAKNYMKMK